MIIEVGEKLHIIYRALCDKSNRRHFVGEVLAVDGMLCRMRGYFFVYDERKTEFFRIEETRTILVGLADSGIICNVIDASVRIEDVRYRYAAGIGLVATDDKAFAMNVNEFGAKH